MTHPVQLELVPSPARPRLGELLVAVQVGGRPVRAKHQCTCLHNRPGTRPYDKWKEFRDAAVPLLRSWWRPRPALYVPVVVQVLAVFERPQEPRETYTVGGVERAYPYPWLPQRIPYVGTPDWDQVGKGGVDVCVQAGILVDDPLVVDASLPRFYAAPGELPHLEVRIWHG